MDNCGIWIRGVITYPIEVAIARTRHLCEGDRISQGRSKILCALWRTCSPRVRGPATPSVSDS